MQAETRRREWPWFKMSKWAVAALLVVVIAGCGAADQSKQSASSASQELAFADSKAAADTSAGGANKATPTASMAAQSAQAGSAADASKPADSFNGSGAESTVDRKIIYRANLTMQVEKFDEAQSKIEAAVNQAGGYVLQFSQNETQYEKNGTYMIKVPAGGFSSLLNQLEKIHPSTQKNMQGQDVSEEYVDLSARLKAKQVVESRLIAFMEKASKTDELLAFSTELGKVQEEIERIKGRMRYLDQNVAYSTIELRLSQKIGSAAVIKAQDGGPLMQRAAAALNGSAAVLLLVFQWIVVIAAAILPVFLVLAILAVPFWLWKRSRSKKLLEIRKKLAEENEDFSGNKSENDDGSAS
ncbi:DUF4349 domain-containing protein [Paenibacillus sp. NPDC056579]|uniref:DUF4349 domain-containing protein n=1 Tax=unclassified Paenibacillus TaxID=185978 RepID=UPI001EF9ADFA|nr:DUF4349 domain-containing protein [Paenibacillus sp. H1-7]ULL17601.1 DUF4349 domain-containing protein [Paenibacillus sp. H1-7]